MKYFKSISLTIIISFTVIIFQACNNNSINSAPLENSELFISLQDAELISMKYIYLENEQYKLKLSKEKASKLGISVEQYTQLTQDIAELNLQIEEIKKKNDPNHELILGDFQQAEILPSSFTRMQTREETYGRFNVSSGQSSYNISIPSGVSNISLSVAIQCPFGLATITVNGVTKTFTNFSSSVDFSIPTSPALVTITATTTCSGGATVGYNY